METTRDIDLALRTVEHVQASIRHADTKIAAVGGGAVFLAGQLAGTAIFENLSGGYLTATIITAALAMTGLLGTAWHLADGLRPRLSSVDAGPLGLVALAEGAGGEQHPDHDWATPELWRLARALARIALDKHLRVRRSLLWVLPALLGTMGFQLLSAIGHIGN